MTQWQLYWLTRLDIIGAMATILSILSAIASFLALMSFVADAIDGRTDPYSLRYLKYALPVFLFFGLLCMFTPSTKEMAAILIVPKIVNNQKVQQMPDKLLDLANQWIDQLSPKESK